MLMCVQHRFRSPWSDLFAHLLERQGFNQTTFGQKVKKAQGVIQCYVVGRARPPRPLLEHWADALDLARTEREEFIFLGYLAWAPKIIQKQMTENMRHLREAQKSIGNLQQRLVDLSNRTVDFELQTEQLRRLARALHEKAAKAKVDLRGIDLGALDVPAKAPELART